jgi:site-specific DNA-methyltransferase (cytosine-N4-specific)
MTEMLDSAAAVLGVGDAKLAHPHIKDGSVAAVITSPPYWARRRYTDDGLELGVGALQEYLVDLVGVFETLRSKLHDEGLLWVNIGDTASGSGGSGGDYAKGCRAGKPKYRQGASGLPPMQWASVPHRFAHLMQEHGWLLRAEVIWDKGMCRPEDLGHVRRPGESHEYVFMFAKGRKYGFDASKLAERGSVWHMSPQRGRTGHQAPMPLELANRCLGPVTAPGAVLDPFAGSGTTLVAAVADSRQAIGVDLDARNAELIRYRIPGLAVTRI